jgi:hypothetical protein
VIVKVAVPPSVTVGVPIVMLKVGSTAEVIVTDTRLGEPIWYTGLGANDTVRTRSASTLLSVIVGMVTWALVCPAGTTMLPAGGV